MIYRKLTDAEKAFLSELNEMMRRHGVVLRREDQYDGADNYAGTEFSFEKWEPRAERAAIKIELRSVGDLLP
jgi:hypothetical protein